MRIDLAEDALGRRRTDNGAMPTALAAIVVALPFAALVGPLTWMARLT